jgi:predicted O-methyltransferase YrrM
MASVVDQPGQASPGLIDLALRAARRAADINLASIAERSSGSERELVNLWPGEHYRLLAALVAVSGASQVVEVGTATGASALALLHGGAEKVTTYDIIPWSEYPGSVLDSADFGPRLEQRIGDLAGESFGAQQRSTLEDADLIFVDGPKDAAFEPAFLGSLLGGSRARPCLLVLDDIRLPPMVPLWRALEVPKLDVTSLGHWSGTGLAEINPGGVGADVPEDEPRS